AGRFAGGCIARRSATGISRGRVRWISGLGVIPTGRRARNIRRRRGTDRTTDHPNLFIDFLEPLNVMSPHSLARFNSAPVDLIVVEKLVPRSVDPASGIHWFGDALLRVFDGGSGVTNVQGQHFERGDNRAGMLVDIVLDR